MGSIGMDGRQSTFKNRLCRHPHGSVGDRRPVQEFRYQCGFTVRRLQWSQVEFTAQVASIDTENEKRDGHLKSPDFFDAEKYPEIKFKGKLEKVGSKYQLKGDLTIKETTKPVTLDVAYGGTVKAFNGERAGFKATGSIKRFDYGLTWDKTIEDGSLIVGDEVQIIAKIEMQKKPNP